MTAYFLALYETPADPEAFDRHYREVHIQLARQLPALRRYTVGDEAAAIRGAPYYLIAELEWDTMEDPARRLCLTRGTGDRRRRGTLATARPGAQHDLHR
jgi:EthD domain